MSLTFCNVSAEYEPINEVPLWKGWTFNRFGLVLSASFGAFATVMSIYLMFMHATHYLKPWEQRHIIRILFMVPVYSVVSFLSYYYYIHTIYFDVLRDCYEAFAIASFFFLLCHYIAPDLHAQKEYFRALKPREWVWPLRWMKRCSGGEHGLLRTPRSGLTWFNIIWFCIFQYCLVRVLMTLVAVVSQIFGRYCLESLSPAFAHIWVICIEGLCVSVAMYAVIQFYVQTRHDLAEHRPGLKVVAIKLVIFLSFWQTIIISFLTSSTAGVITETPQMAMPDVKIGLPALLLCIEMAIFSILHTYAYPWKDYDVNRSPIVAAESGTGFAVGRESYKGGFLGYKAFLDAFNPWDLVKAVGRGFKWMLHDRKHREHDVSYKQQKFQGNGTTLDSSRANEAGKYQQLGDDDSELRRSFGEVHPQDLASQSTFTGDEMGAIGYGRRQDLHDERTTMPSGNGHDTRYYGAQEPNPLDPRDHWAGSQR